MSYIEKAQELRNAKDTTYNCAQSVIIPFAQDMGLSENQVCVLGSHFGAGMRHGSTCGAITGALMVLGCLGYDEKEAMAILHQMKERHGATDCPTLLRTSHERGEPRKAHCDGLVYEMVETLSALVRNKK